MEWILIAATGKNGEMGLNGRLPWEHPEDLQLFKTVTMGSPLIMGRKTFESLPRLLKGRPHLVLSHQFSRDLGPNVTFFTSLKDIPLWCHNKGYSKAFVIGGQKIYTLLAPFCSQIVLTKIDSAFDADTFFPLEILKGLSIRERKILTGPSFINYTAEVVTYDVSRVKPFTL